MAFENPDSGFFLRPNVVNGPGGDGNTLEGLAGTGGILKVEKFTVLDGTRPALIRASYGPFSTKQTVPARFVLPQFPEDENATLTASSDVVGGSQLEVSAHIISKRVTRARPTIRVLIHGSGAKGHHSAHVCVTVLVRMANRTITASCTPVEAEETGGDATCLVDLNIPANWWPPNTRSTVKIPRTTVYVSYMIGTAESPEKCMLYHTEELDSYNYPVGVGPRVTVQPETPVGEVMLGLEEQGYEEVSKDPLVQIMVPRAPLYPGTSLHVPVYLNPSGNLPALMIVMRYIAY